MIKLTLCVLALFIHGCASQPEPKKEFFNTKINQEGWRIFSFSSAIPHLDKKRKPQNAGRKTGKKNPDGKGPRHRGKRDHNVAAGDEIFNKMIDKKIQLHLKKYPACINGYEELDRYSGTAYMTIKGQCYKKVPEN